MSKTKTTRKLANLDEKLLNLFNTLDQYPESALNFQLNGAWSALQVLEHLKTSETLSSSYIQYNIGKGKEFPSLGVRNAIKSGLLKFWLHSPIKMKAPKFNGLSPENEGLEYQLIKNDWLEMRKDLKHYLENLKEIYYEKAVFKHFFAGRMSIYQMMIFFEAHFIRHQRQILNRLDKIDEEKN